MFTLRNKLFFGILCCSLVVMAFLGAIAIPVVSTVLTDDAEQSLVWLARYHARDFSVGFELIEDKVQELQLHITKTVDVQQLRTDRSYLTRYEQKLAKFVEDFANKRTTGKAGWVYFDSHWSDVPHDVYLVDGNGDGKAERQPYIPFSYYDMTPKSDDDKEWWYGPVRSGKGFWTNPYVWILRHGEQIEVCSFAQPVYMDNVLIGVVGTYYRFKDIVETVQAIKVYETGYATLYNEKLDVIVHPQFSTGTRYTSDNLLHVREGGLRQVGEYMLAKPYGVVSYELDGKRQIMAYATLPNGWFLALHPPLQEVYASLHQIQCKLGAAALGCLVLALLLAIVTSRSLGGPFVQLALAAKAVEDGHLDRRVQVRGRDEVASLARSINAMAESMQDMSLCQRQSQQRLAAIVDGVGMYTWDYDVRKGQVQHNAHFMHIVGEPGIAQEGVKDILWLRERIHPADVHRVDALESLVGVGTLVSFELRLRIADGSWRWYKNMGRVEECDSLNHARRIVGTGFDIQAQKALQISEAEQKQRLEELVEQRTRELQESRNQAIVASNAKTAFLSTVSHEIRTPMNAIVGFAHIFERANLSTVQVEYLDKIKLSAGALLNVINDVLDISKIEAGKLELDAVPFQLHRVLDTVCSIVSFAAKDKSLTLDVDVAGDVPEVVRGDPKRMSQILLNLMNNAVKFTSQGYVRLNVMLSGGDVALPPGRVLVAFSVEDTGIGLSDEQIGRLFTPFTQADSSISRKFGGTGLGLAICKQLVELMNGNIGVASTPGKGSLFYFTLPLEVIAAESKEPLFFDASEATSGQDVALLLRGRQVLVVEDNPINQEIAKALLEECGLDVSMASNGLEAVHMVEKDCFDCIFMDIQMPVMDGLEATRILRAMGDGTSKDLVWLRQVPIIAMTANAMTEDRHRCLEVGMNDHVAKPFDLEILHQTLLRWIART